MLVFLVIHKNIGSQHRVLHYILSTPIRPFAELLNCLKTDDWNKTSDYPAVCVKWRVKTAPVTSQ